MTESPYIREILSMRKLVRLNNLILERVLTLFEKQLAYFIQTDRGAVLKLNSFFLLVLERRKKLHCRVNDYLILKFGYSI